MSAPILPETASPDTPYDFRRPHRISTDKLRTLEAMYERLARSLEGWLLSRARVDVQLVLDGVERVAFGELSQALPSPCAAYTFEVRNAAGREGMIDFGLDFAFFLVDRLFGGTADPLQPGRALTPLERIGVRTVAERVLGFVSDIWHELFELDLALTGFESMPDILRVANREDPVLVATFGVIMGEHRSRLLVCLPVAVLEKFFAGMTERRVTLLGTPEEQAMTQRQVETSIRSTRVSFAVRTPAFRLSLRELLALHAGSVVATGVPRSAPLEVFIGAQRRFLAAPGRVGSALAVRITDSAVPSAALPAHPVTRT